MASHANYQDENYFKFTLACKELKELRASLRLSEQLLAKTGLENAQFSNMLQETDDLNKKLECDLEREVSRADSTESRCEQATLQINLKTSEIERLNAQLLAREREWTEERAELLKEATETTEGLLMAQEEVVSMKEAWKRTEKKLKLLVAHSNEPSTKGIEREVKDPFVFPHQLIRLVSQISVIKQENNRLVLDNTKLFSMVDSVKQLAEFATMRKDSGGLTFVTKEDYSKKLKCSDTKGEWLPTDVHRVIADVNKRKTFSKEDVNGIIYKLDKIWQEREKRRLEREKQRFRHKLFKLKRDPETPLKTPFKTPSKSVQQFTFKLQEEFIEVLCERIEEFSEILAKRGEELTTSQEWLVDHVVSALNEYTKKLLERIL